jgi:hypothetical protein
MTRDLLRYSGIIVLIIDRSTFQLGPAHWEAGESRMLVTVITETRIVRP